MSPPRGKKAAAEIADAGVKRLVVNQLAIDLYNELPIPLGDSDVCNEEHVAVAEKLHALGWRKVKP